MIMGGGYWRDVYPMLPTLNDTDAEFLLFKNKVIRSDVISIKEGCVSSDTGITLPESTDGYNNFTGLYITGNFGGYKYLYIYTNNLTLYYWYNTVNGTHQTGSRTTYNYITTSTGQRMYVQRLYDLSSRELVYVQLYSGVSISGTSWDSDFVYAIIASNTYHSLGENSNAPLDGNSF